MRHNHGDAVTTTNDIELEQEPFLKPGNVDDNDEDDQQCNGKLHPSTFSLALYFAGIALLTFSSLTSIYILFTPQVPSMDPTKIFPELLYTPVESLLEYNLVRFHTGFFDDEEPSVFDGPTTDAMDKAWTDLYDIWTYSISSLTEDENDRLADPTIPAFGNASQLYGGIDVFHQLHCLDYVRQAIEPERYGHHGHHHVKRTPPPFHSARKATTDLPHVADDEHIAHCIDMVRQSLMCSADISVISWYMPTPLPEHKAKPLPRFDQTRMCRNFEKLREWAGSRTPDKEALDRIMPHGN